MSRYPFPAYPNSWFQLAWADEVSGKKPLDVAALGTKLRLTRDANGAVHARDLHDPDRAWPIREVNDMVFAFHHAGGRAPDFDVPELVEAASSAWTQVGRFEWILTTHAQEFVENIVDMAHFECLHSFAEPPRLLELETGERSLKVRVASTRTTFGITQPIELALDYAGLGFGVGRVFTPFAVSNVVTCLPVDEEHVRQRFTIYAKIPRIPVVRTVLGVAIRRAIHQDVAQELSILHHKRYLDRPLLVKGDGPIPRLREWCGRFYGGGGVGVAAPA